MSKNRRILGIDPGTRVLGYGMLDVADRKPVLTTAGSLRMPPGTPSRLHKIFDEIRSLIASYSPDVLSIERVFHGRNFQSILKLGEARGVVLLAAQMERLEVCEYTPAEVKKSVTGNGNAAKSQVQRMMTRILGLNEQPEPTDVSDALAVAFCCSESLWRSRRLGRVSG